MEDNSNSKSPPATAVTSKAKVIDLTPDMELPAESSGKIIDLTNVLHIQSAQPEQNIKAASKPSKSEPNQRDGQDSAADDFTPAAVEEQVEAAFNAFQASPSAATGQQKPNAADEKVQELTPTAGNALHQKALKSQTPVTAEPEVSQGQPVVEKAGPVPEPQEPASPQEHPVAELADQPAELEASANDFKADASDETDEAPIELTEIVDSNSLEMSEQTLRSEQDSDEDEIIELTEMINPAQLTIPAANQGAPPEEAGDDEIIELTDIVEPVELGLPDLSVDDADEVLELTDIVDSRETMPAMPPSEPSPPISTDRQGFQTKTDAETELRLKTVQPSRVTPKENDQVIQLADVLNNVRQGDMPRPDDVAMDLDKDLMADTLDEEQDDRASALGMALGEESLEGSTAVADKEIEEAIERIIRTKYAQSIEKLIAQAVEKIVTREIKNIKRAIMDDSEPSP